MWQARSPLQQFGADEQRTQRVGRLHGQHRIAGGAVQRTHGIGMQRAKLDPFDRAEIGDEAVGLSNSPDRHRLAVQIDLENRPGKRPKAGYQSIHCFIKGSWKLLYLQFA